MNTADRTEPALRLVAPHIHQNMGRRTIKPFAVQGVTFTGMADKGKCAGRTPEGQVVFAEAAAPGDVADVLVRKKKDESKKMKEVALKVLHMYTNSIMQYHNRFQRVHFTTSF